MNSLPSRTKALIGVSFREFARYALPSIIGMLIVGLQTIAGHVSLDVVQRRSPKPPKSQVVVGQCLASRRRHRHRGVSARVGFQARHRESTGAGVAETSYVEVINLLFKVIDSNPHLTIFVSS